MSVAVAKTSEEPIVVSPIHEMAGQLERLFDAQRLNVVINQPDVQRWVKGYMLPPLDFSAMAANPANVLLMGEHGGMFFTPVVPGIYECHTQVMKQGRGEWAHHMVRACLMLMFTRTDCMEIVTKVPQGNIGARVMTKLCGFKSEFVQQKGWVVDLDPVRAEWFSLSVQEWMRSAPGLAERGAWFHDRLAIEMKKVGKTEENHPHDPVHDQYVGGAVEFAIGGQHGKMELLYNRWAAMAGYLPIQVNNPHPLIVNIGSGVIRFDGEDFCVLKVL